MAIPGFKAKTVDSVTAKLTKMVDELLIVSSEQEARSQNLRCEAAGLVADAVVASGEASRANSIASKIQALLS